MAANLHGPGSYYMATLEELNTCNEIHKRYLDLNLQVLLLDQQLRKLVQDCSEIDVSEVLYPKKAVEQLKNDRDKLKESLSDLLSILFQSKCSMDIRSLEGFVLEQEVYDQLLSTTKIEELKFFMAKIEEFTKFVDDRNMKARDMQRELDRMPKNLNLETWNLGPSGDFTTQIPQQQGFNNTSHMGNMENCLSKVMAVMYGLTPDVALDIQKSLASRKLVSEAFKIKNGSMFLNDLNGKKEEFGPLDFLDDEVVSENCEPDLDAETLHWKNLSVVKRNFEDMVKDLLNEDKQNVDRNCLRDEILQATRDFVFHVETVLCDLVHIFYNMMSGYNPAVNKFQKFKSALKELRESQNGMVPIVVYKVLAMNNISCQGVESDKEALYEEIEFDRVIHTFRRIFLHLAFVLKKSTSHAQAILNMRMLIACQTTLSQSEKLMREIALKIYGVNCRLPRNERMMSRDLAIYRC